jgi:hypothetical protein
MCESARAGFVRWNLAAHVSRTKTWPLGPTSNFRLKKGEAV